MPILNADKIQKHFGAKTVLKSVSFRLEAGEKAGLVGKNGSGKTTLLEILAGRLEPDGGAVSLAKDVTLGYLTQELEFDPNLTVYEEIRKIFFRLDQIQSEIRKLEEAIASCAQEDAERLEPLLRRYAELQERFERDGGFRIDGDIQAVLSGLGLSRELWDQSPVRLSGGERTRAALARLLLLRPGLLLLDEPTNYLDLQAVRWLEDFLKEYAGAVLIVSHDRYFLDRIVTKIFALSEGQVETYRGNYSYYREVWSARRQAQMRAYLQQQKEISRKEKFIRESGAAEKEKRHAKSVEKRLAKIERIERPRDEETIRAPALTSTGRTGKIVLSVSGLAKSFPGKTLWSGLNFKVGSGERIVLMGPNGSGKSTFLRVLYGEEQPDAGRVEWGHGVVVGYYSQILKDADLAGTPYDQIIALSDLSPAQARTFLGAFLFSGDDVFLPVKELSGGEQRRLSLAKLVLSPANVLLLDEPTNHLDLPSLDALEEAILGYAGTVIVVTHDRYFASRIAQRLFVLENGSFREFDCYEAYEAWRNELAARAAEEKRLERGTKIVRHRERLPDPAAELRKRRKELERLEQELERLERQKSEILETLSRPEVYTDFAAAQKYSSELQETEERLEETFNAWASLAESLPKEG